ncbi:PAS domain-containing protein [Pararoseomonas sp. SCSIO 73927]|uniref:PAS domain-containing protein n=1 Tax=Pararoseomonas sp. SCSIO 73927 TaxID=3114537 RepID=UPI0030D222B7
MDRAEDLSSRFGSPGQAPPAVSGESDPDPHLLRARFRTLAEAIPQLVWLSCSRGLWTWASPQWLDFTGQHQAQSHGHGWLSAVHPEDRGVAMRAWEEAQEHGLLDVVLRIRRAGDGAWCRYQVCSYPVRGAPGPGGREGPIHEWVGISTPAGDPPRG